MERAYADVAQLVEQSIRNRQVTGSIPVVGSRDFEGRSLMSALRVCRNRIALISRAKNKNVDRMKNSRSKIDFGL